MVEFKPLNLDALLQDIKSEKWYRRVWWWVRYGIWGWLEGRPREIKFFVQRGRRGWAEKDAWSFDHYLARVIKEGISYLRKISHGRPAIISDQKEWDTILADIEFAFTAAEKICFDEWYSPSAGWALSDTGWTEEWYTKWTKEAEEDEKKFGFPSRAMTKEEVERYGRGWELFRKFFFHLWD